MTVRPPWGSRAGRPLATAALGAAMLVLLAPGTAVALWNDDEFVRAGLRTLDCAAADGAFESRAEGRLMSGGLLGADLDSIAEVSGMRVTNDATQAHPDPSTAGQVGQDAWANPLNVAVLDTIALDLNGVSTNLEDVLNLGTGAGAVGQYARASSDGTSLGASGLVSNNGALNLVQAGGMPDLASIDLGTVVRASLGTAAGEVLAGVTGLRLGVGVLGGRAFLDGCARAWGAGISQAVDRDYLMSGLDLTVASPLVGNLVARTSAVVAQLQQAVNGIAGSDSVATAIENGVVGLLNALPAVRADATVTASINLSALTDPTTGLLHATRSDSGGVVTVNLNAGTVAVDLAALLAKSYPGEFSNGLNGLPPNTELLISNEVITTLTTTLNQVLLSWLAEVNAALQAARDAIAVRAHVDASFVPVLVRLDLLDVDVPAGGGTARLADLLAGNVNAQVTVLGGVSLGGALSALVNGVGLLVGTTVSNALPTVASLTSPLVATAVNPLVDQLGDLFAGLFVPQGGKPAVLSLAVNSQNDPGTTTCLDIGIGCVPPPEWDALPEGRFDVAALRIGVLDALGGVTTAYLGRGSVGVTCPVIAGDPACAGY